MGHDYKLPGGAAEKIIFSCVYFTLGRDILIVSVEIFFFVFISLPLSEGGSTKGSVEYCTWMQALVLVGN